MYTYGCTLNVPRCTHGRVSHVHVDNAFPIYMTICRSLYFHVCILIYVNVYFQFVLYIVMLRK